MRNVYYDPFGMRLEGYRAGVGDEMQLQANTRNARQSDWNYENVLPLELQGAQREEAFQQWADPTRRRSTEGALFDTELNRAGIMGQATGIQQPIRDVFHNYFRPTSAMSEVDPQTGIPAGPPTYAYPNGAGGYTQGQYSDQSLFDYFGRQHGLALADQNLQAAGVGLQQQGLADRRYEFDATLPIQQRQLQIQQINAEVQRLLYQLSLAKAAAGGGGAIDYNGVD